jgi:hypothetical protein
VHELGQLPSVPLHRNGEQLGDPAAPAPTGTQVPPAPLQVSQPPPHALAQQTPSAQKPDAQVVPAPLQLWPLLLRQLPLPSHELLPPQAPAGTLSAPYCGTGTHVPLAPVHWLHVVQLLAQQWPSRHAPGHCVSFVQASPFDSLQSMS